MKEKKKIAVLMTDMGYHLQVLMGAQAEGAYPGKIVLVISDNEKSQGYRRAEAQGLLTRCIDPKDYSSLDEYFDRVSKILDLNMVDYILIPEREDPLTKGFVDRYKGRLILVKSFISYGFGKSREKDGSDILGIEVKLIEDENLGGKLIVEEALPIFPDDTSHNLKSRLMKLSNGVLPKAMYKICRGEVTV